MPSDVFDGRRVHLPNQASDKYCQTQTVSLKDSGLSTEVIAVNWNDESRSEPAVTCLPVARKRVAMFFRLVLQCSNGLSDSCPPEDITRLSATSPFLQLMDSIVSRATACFLLSLVVNTFSSIQRN